jgi:cyclophilin family peptidyl-prolyl cis-trans isomerase/HEAT repeat protein
MHIACFLLLLLFGLPERPPAHSTRSDTIEAILRLQDQRSGSDPRLTLYLADGDPVVRERAAMACASIQDTTLLPELLDRLTDEDTAVRQTAAFAIGQTGLFLSATGKARLEDACLTLCASENAPPRLLEEIGKFGSGQSLSRLVSLAHWRSKQVEREALIMGIARFAIRGVCSDTATRFLVGLADSATDLPWQVAYALQRIAPHPGIEVQTAIRLADHHDPLIRMNAAALLGKLADTLGSSAVLVRLSSDDPDWRVRVNAIKALGTPSNGPVPSVINRFVEAFSDTNEHVALAAIAAFGDKLKGSGYMPEPAERELWEIADGATPRHLTRRRAEAFTTLAKIEGPKAYKRLAQARLAGEWLQARHAIALGSTGDSLALPELMRRAKQNNPLVSSSALEGLQHLAELNPGKPLLLRSIAACAVDRLMSTDISVLSVAASMAADTLLRSPAAVPALLRSLESLREPDDVEAMQTIIQTLGVLRDERAIVPLRKKLRGSDRSVAESAAASLQALTGRSYRSEIRITVTPMATAMDFAFLRGIPDTVVVEMQTTAGLVGLELYPGIAPFTVMSFLRLASKKFFDGLLFHRVVPNFVVQGGDPRGDGWGGPGYALRSELSLHRYDRGTLGMASAGKDTEGSQFFITHSPQPHLDGRYTVFGRVRNGMDVVDHLQVGDTITHVTVSTRARN